MRDATRYLRCMATASLIHDIEAFIERTGMAESGLGRAAVNDWRFVRDLRGGRRVWPETEAKVRSFMELHSSEVRRAAA